MTTPPLPSISAAELDSRVDRVREKMAAHRLDALLVSSPENIYYLSGLDHWGYFAPHILIVPMSGRPHLVTRQMEQVTIRTQVTTCDFTGHSDSETVADAAVRAMTTAAVPASARLGVERWSAGLPAGLAEALAGGLPNASWVDATDLVDALRQVKSPTELALLRDAARVSDAAMAAGIDAVADGAGENDVAAACYAAMLRAGGTYPGFGPFIRPGRRLGEEHTTWSRERLKAGEPVFFELAGCVARYHAPLGRLVFLGEPPPATRAMERICLNAFDAVVDALKPGVLAREVYAAWQQVVDRAGLAHYRRHHCGYQVGIGCPPSWTGGNKVLGLRHDSDLELQAGMSFHILSWLMNTGAGDYFISNTVVLGEHGAEVLTRYPGTLGVSR